MNGVLTRLGRLERLVVPPAAPPPANVILVSGRLVVDGVVLSQVAERLRQWARPDAEPAAVGAADTPECVEARRLMAEAIRRFEHNSPGAFRWKKTFQNDEPIP